MAEEDDAQGISSRDYYTTMAHFYRGELGRALVWRQRLDATTNWAVLSSTGIVTFALGNPGVSHIVFMLANLAVLILMGIEGRRYRYYDAYRSRVRILEGHLLVPVVMKNQTPREGDWRRLLAEDLLIPSFKITWAEAAGKRLNKNYRWIFLVIVATFFLKIVLHHENTDTLAGFFAAVHAGQPLHPVLYWVIVAAFYGTLAYLAVQGRHTGGMHDEFARPTPKPEAWSL